MLSLLFQCPDIARASTVKPLCDAFIKSIEELKTYRKAQGKRVCDNYLVALAKLQTKFQSEGDLDGYLAVKNEIERFREEKTLPANPSEKMSPAMKDAQAKCKGALVSSRRDETLRAKALAEKHVKRMDLLKRKLTTEGKLKEAVAAKKASDTIKAKLKSVQGQIRDCSFCDGKGYLETRCRSCGGEGICRSCRGSGISRGMNGRLTKCFSCKGSGKCVKCNGEGTEKRACTACSGKGKVVEGVSGDLLALLLSKKEIPVGAQSTTIDPKPAVASRPSRPKDTRSKKEIMAATKREMQDHVQTMGNLYDLYRKGEFERAPFDQVINDSNLHKGKLYVSNVNIYYAHARNVKVAATASQAAKGVTTLIPYNQRVGSKAEAVFKEVGRGGSVTITYGVVNNENVTLFAVTAR